MKDVDARVAAARTALVLEQPFFGMLALHLTLEACDAVPTMATNGAQVRYNPAFVARLSRAELEGVLAHEVLHCANGHMWRRESRDPLGWNIACDYAINPIVTGAGFVLPHGVLLDGRYVGKSAEWIYERDEQAQGAANGQTVTVGDAPGTGAADVQDGDGADNAPEASAMRAEWADRLTQAAKAAQMHGKLPAGCERWVEQVVQPKVDWRIVLRRFVQATAREDYTWARPNTRFLGQGLYLPSLRSEAMGPIAVAVDTSGSIDGVTLSQFAAELNAIRQELRPTNTHVIYADVAVAGHDEYGPDDDVTLHPKGGGGTAFGPALDAIEALDDDPCCAVYLTDLWGEHREDPPSLPLLWVTVGARDAPYGEIVPLES